MSVPTITGLRLGQKEDAGAGLPLLVCGPSLGTSVAALWSSTATLLGDRFDVVGWDLPGHGENTAVVAEDFTIAELAEGVLAFVDRVLVERGDPGSGFIYAGDSVGGAVGQQLMLDHPGRIRASVLACTAAWFGDEQSWHDRAELVRTAGTAALVEASGQRWFRPGFVDEEPAVAGALLQSLRDTDPTGYAAVCGALARFDVRDELRRIDTPVVALAGAYDVAAPVAAMAELADGVAEGTLVVLHRVGHLAPAENPQATAQAIRQVAGPVTPTTVADRRAAGMAVRRAVLGDAHVDRASAATSDLTREFQEFITDYAWGGIWTRPGLDRRSRSMITLTALVARGHHEELVLHLRAARTNGLTLEEIKEVLLQSAIYCGVPDANTAFRIARQTFEED